MWLRPYIALAFLHSLRAAATQGDEHPWAMFRHDASNTGRTATKGPAADAFPITKWNITLLGTLKAAPSVAADGHVFAGTNAGYLYAVNASTGDVIWKRHAAPYSTCGVTPAIYGSGDGMVVIAGCMDGVVYCLNATTGDVLWTRSTTGGVFASVVVSNSIVYVCSLDTQVYALRIADGTVLWNFATGSPLSSPPAVGADGSVYVLNSVGSVFSLESFTGTLLWTVATSDPVSSDPPQAPVLSDGFVYITTAQRMMAFHAVNGSRVWARSGSWSGTPALLLDGTLVGANGQQFGGLAGVDPRNGSVRWTVDVPVSDKFGWPSVDGQGLVYATSPNFVAAFTVPPPTTGRGFSWVCICTGSVAVGNDILFLAKSDRLAAVGRQPAPIPADSWVTAGHDAGHTGRSGYAGPPVDSPIGPVWTASVGGSIWTSPVIGPDGTVYAVTNASFEDTVYALEPGTARVKWSYRTTAYGLPSSLTLGGNGKLYVATEWQEVFAIFAENGSFAWSWQAPWESTGARMSGEVLGRIYIGLRDGFQALDAETGHELWSYTAAYQLFSMPAVGANGLVVSVDVGDEGGLVYAFDAVTGFIAWKTPITLRIVGAVSITPDGALVVIPVSGGVRVLDASNGTVLTSSDGDAVERLPLPQRGALALGEYKLSALGINGTIYVPDGGTLTAYTTVGGFLWSLHLPGTITSPALDAAGILYVGCADSNVYAINSMTGATVWAYPTGGPVTTAPAIAADGTIIVGSADTNVYALGVGAAPQNPWPMRGHDALHTGRSQYAGPAGPSIEMRWKVSLAGSIVSSPIITGDGDVLVGSSLSHVYKVEKGVGTACVQTKSAVTSSPAIPTTGAAYAYAGSLDGNVYAFMPRVCTLRWSIAVGAAISSSPVISGDTLFVGAQDGNLFAYDTSTGATLWHAATSGPINSSPAATESAVIVGSNDGNLYAFDTSDGHMLWQLSTGGAVGSSPALAASGAAFVGSLSGKLYGVNITDGHLLWTFETGAGILSSPALSVDESIVVVGSNDGCVYGLSSIDGARRWTFETPAKLPVVASPAIGSNNVAYIGTNDATMYALDVMTGVLVWSFLAGGSIQSSAAIAADGTLFFGCNDGNLYGLTTQP